MKQDDKRIKTLRDETPWKAVIKMGLPLTAGMMIMVLYNLVDTYFIGLMHDDYQLAAVNLAYPVMMIMIAVSNMVGVGAASLIARSMGAGDDDTSNHTLTAGFVLTVINSIIIGVLGLVFLKPVCIGLGAGDNTLKFTMQYAGALFAGSFLTMGNYTFGQLLRAEGSVKYSVTGMIAGTVANIILDPIFIFGLDMQILGAAIATVLGNGVGCLIQMIYYVKKKTILRPKKSFIKPSREILKEIYWVGVPATLETLFTAGATVVNNNLAAAYGELTVAAMGVASKLLTFGSYVYQGFAAGIQPLMGYSFGAKNYSRMKKHMWAGIFVTSGIEIALMVIYGIFARPLVGIFTETQEVITTGALTLRVNMLFLPFVGAIAVSRSTFQAMGKPQYAFTITVLRQIAIYIPMLLIFNRLFGFKGLISALPSATFVTMIIAVSMLSLVLKKFEMQER